MRHLYMSCTGDLFTTQEKLMLPNLYCEQCDNNNSYIGEFENFVDFWNLIKDICSIDGSAGLNLQYIFPYIAEEFDLNFIIFYDSYDDKDQGFCSNTDKDILEQIETMLNNM